MTIDALAAAGNGVWSASATVVAIMAIVALRTRSARLTPAAKQMCVGVAIAALSSAAHRTWWNVGIWFREAALYATWTTEHRWVPLLFIVGIVAGTWIAVAPYARLLVGRCWAAILVAYLVAVGTVSAWLA